MKIVQFTHLDFDNIELKMFLSRNWWTIREKLVLKGGLVCYKINDIASCWINWGIVVNALTIHFDGQFEEILFTGYK